MPRGCHVDATWMPIQVGVSACEQQSRGRPSACTPVSTSTLATPRCYATWLRHVVAPPATTTVESPSHEPSRGRDPTRGRKDPRAAKDPAATQQQHQQQQQQQKLAPLSPLWFVSNWPCNYTRCNYSVITCNYNPWISVTCNPPSEPLSRPCETAATL
jgi:hypothetical protein